MGQFSKPGLWAQLSHSLCFEYLWQVYKHLYMSHKGKLQILTKLSMRHQVYPMIQKWAAHMVYLAYI